MVTIERLRQKLAEGAYNRQLTVDCCCKEGAAERILQVCNGFCATFQADATQPVEIFSAPGRTEICGNHTDHQHGHVLAASVNLDMLACVTPNQRKEIRLLSEGFPMECIDLQVLTPQESEQNTSASLLRGIAARITQLGYTVEGFDAYVISDVLTGSGLSSSAAYEVLIANIFNRFCCDGKLSAIEIAQIGQYAENHFFGKPCGLMDQMASSVGGIISIDFADPKSPQVKQVPFDFAASGYALCIIDSGANHADLTADYADIPKEMGQIAAFFGKSVLQEVDSSLIWDNLPALRAAAGDRAVLRAIHYFEDDRRATEEARALADGAFDAFLRLVDASGKSSFMHLQNVFTTKQPREQAVAIALAAAEEALGCHGACRVHGGGFAGTIQAFVPLQQLPSFQEQIKHLLGEHACHVLSIRPIGGTVLIAE